MCELGRMRGNWTAPGDFGSGGGPIANAVHSDHDSSFTGLWDQQPLRSKTLSELASHAGFWLGTGLDFASVPQMRGERVLNNSKNFELLEKGERS
eukprot:829020-Pyramimonas_sp.AAC.1